MKMVALEPLESMNSNDKKTANDGKQNLKGVAVLLGISGVLAGAAGYVATKIAKKKGDEYYKGVNMEPPVILESPPLLALRALAWSGVLSVSVFSIVVFGLCKCMGISSMEDLRETVKKYRKSAVNPDERTEFENLSDFLNYLNETYKSK